MTFVVESGTLPQVFASKATLLTAAFVNSLITTVAYPPQPSGASPVGATNIGLGAAGTNAKRRAWASFRAIGAEASQSRETSRPPHPAGYSNKVTGAAELHGGKLQVLLQCDHGSR
jgi:hypothetical protein